MTLTLSEAQAPAAQDGPWAGLTAHAPLIEHLDAARLWLAAHPAIPVTSVTADQTRTNIHKLCATTAEVDWIAGHLGITAKWRCSGTQYAARLWIRTDCEYEVAYVAGRDAQDMDPAGREADGAAA